MRKKIFGVGVDIVKIKRFENISEAFLSRVFTAREREYITRACREKNFCSSQNFHHENSHFNTKINIQSAAGIFAAKEAVAKAFGTGFRGFSPQDVEILHKENGKPYVVFHKKPRRLKIQISISHTDSDAIAFAVIQ
ncbi:MAG: holo-ACP synthase [Defluviitaleaceae bacterium]|nr:holo-ACP synthase [Defluviitaleaceae bacterium]